jgi:DMSO/TMAO reductase YedYZ molybdopterin-dependent catalytic subunit
MGVPRIAGSDWILQIGGLVDVTMALDLAALKALPKRIVESVHKCAGDPLDATRPTRQVANVQWGGADLRDVLRGAGVSAPVTHLWASGADHGILGDGGQALAVAEYQKDVPWPRVAEGGVLVAYEMNGEPLLAAHGYPARLVVPGYYGTNSVKWLTRLEARDARSASIFTTTLYNDAVPANGDPQARRPLWRMAPESVIVSPAPHASFTAGEKSEIWGWAWSAGTLRGVDISSDGGASWNAAELEVPHETSVTVDSMRAWRRFSFSWTPQKAGAYTLMSRAVDETGAQPLANARNAVHRVEIVVR